MNESPCAPYEEVAVMHLNSLCVPIAIGMHFDLDYRRPICSAVAKTFNLIGQNKLNLTVVCCFRKVMKYALVKVITHKLPAKLLLDAAAVHSVA